MEGLLWHVKIGRQVVVALHGWIGVSVALRARR